MLRCPFLAIPTPSARCGAALAAQPAPLRQRSPCRKRWLQRAVVLLGEFLDEGRFSAGTVLADRYRVIGLPGSGGMGEVCRANDLRLGQAVALKFLPESTTGNERTLARYHADVRIARDDMRCV